MSKFRLPREARDEQRAGELRDRADLLAEQGTMSSLLAAHRLLGEAEDLEDTDLTPDQRVARNRTANLAAGMTEMAPNVRRQDVGAVRRRLLSTAEDDLAMASAQVEGRETTWISDEDFKQFNRRLDSGLSNLRRAREIRELTTSPVRVTREPKVYGKRSAHSWFIDTAIASTPALRDAMSSRLGGSDLSPAGVEARLSRHASEVQYAIRSGSKYGRQVEAMLHERRRQPNEQKHRDEAGEEIRALTTGGGATATAPGSAAALVPPQFVLKGWAPFRGVASSFAAQCDKSFDLPEYGMEVYLPFFATTDRVSRQTEGAAIAETVPTAELEGAKVETVTGQVILTNQLTDRGFTGGGSFDKIMGEQLGQQLRQEIDVYTLAQAISNGEPVAGQATFSLENLYKDIAAGREKLTDTAGTRLRPTHFFSTSDFYNYVTRQFDNQGRPIWTPKWAEGFPLAVGADRDTENDPQWSRFLNSVLPSGLLWLSDDNIPNVGTTNRTQLLVSAPETAVVLMESVPYLATFPETYAGSLETLVSLRAYVCAITRHKAGTSVISSQAYLTSQV